MVFICVLTPLLLVSSVYSTLFKLSHSSSAVILALSASTLISKLISLGGASLVLRVVSLVVVAVSIL